MRTLSTEDLNDESYSQVGKPTDAAADGSTDDVVALNDAVDTVATTDYLSDIVLDPKTYALGRRVVGDHLEGGVKLKADVGVGMRGAELKLTHNAAFITSGPQDMLDLTHATITADVAVGDTVLTVDSSAAFAVGDEIGLRLADNPWDSVECQVFVFAKVKAITDGTHLTVDRPLLVEVDVSDTETRNKIVFLFDPGDLLVDTAITGPGTLNNPMTGSANAEASIYLRYARDVLIERIRCVDPGAGLILAYCENVHIRQLRVDHSEKQGGQASKGRALTVYNSVGVVVDGLHAESFEGVAVYAESYARLKVRDARLVLNHPDRTNGQAVIQVNQGSTADFENLVVEGAGTGQVLFDNGGTPGNYTVRNLDLMTSSKILGGLMPAYLSGRCRILEGGEVYEYNLDHETRWYGCDATLANGQFIDVSFPPGLMVAIEIWCSASVVPASDFDHLYVGRASGSMYDHVGSLVAGKKYRNIDRCTYGTNYVESEITKRVRVVIDTKASGVSSGTVKVRVAICSHETRYDTSTFPVTLADNAMAVGL